MKCVWRDLYRFITAMTTTTTKFDESNAHTFFQTPPPSCPHNHTQTYTHVTLTQTQSQTHTRACRLSQTSVFLTPGDWVGEGGLWRGQSEVPQCLPLRSHAALGLGPHTTPFSEFGSHEVDVGLGQREQRQAPLELRHILHQGRLGKRHVGE